MSMHLVGPQMTTTKYNRKQKKSKNKRLAQAQAEHEAWLAKMGVGKNRDALYNRWGKRKGLNECPDLKVESNIKTSNSIPANGSSKKQNKYTGNEIAGIVTTHKSNLMPVRKDNKQAAKDAASMRR